MKVYFWIHVYWINFNTNDTLQSTNFLLNETKTNNGKPKWNLIRTL